MQGQPDLTIRLPILIYELIKMRKILGWLLLYVMCLKTHAQKSFFIMVPLTGNSFISVVICENLERI